MDWTNIEGWRIAFVVVGLPKVLVAMLVDDDQNHPGLLRSAIAKRGPRARLERTFAELKRKPSFWWMAIAASLVAFVGYGLISFQARFSSVSMVSVCETQPYVWRTALSARRCRDIWVVISPNGRPSASQPPWHGYPPSASRWRCPHIAAFFSQDLGTVFVLWGIGAVFHYSYLGAQYNIGQGVVGNRSRATAIAVLLILVSVVATVLAPIS